MLMSDKWITKASQGDRPLIAPFINLSVSRLASGHNVTSFGLSSYGYDLALGNKFKVLRKTSNSTGARFIDPNNFDPYLFVDQEVQDGDVFVLPPGSFALGVTRERMIMPDDIMGVCMQKSTIARSALEVTVTPIEAGWEGWLTLELHNKTDLPIHLRPGMGIVQLMFFQGIEPCSVPYHARNGKYNNQEQAPVAPRAKQHEVPAVTGALTVTAEAYEEAFSLLDLPPLEPHDISTNTPSVGAAVLGAVKNAIGRTKVDVEIDPDEPDSQAVFDLIKTEVVRAKQIQTTPNSVNPTDVLNQIQAASIEFQVTGAKGLPSTKVQFSETNTNYARPDEELNKELTDLLINHIGVPPEMIEDARRPDFATVAIANNVLFSKRVRGMQQRFDPQLAHLVRNMLMSDATFIIELKGVILENIELVTNRKDQSEEITKIKENKPALVDLLCSEFISGLVTTLSRPDLKSIDNNLEALQKHEEMIDKALANIFSQDALDPSLVGEKTFERIEAVRKAAKAALVRRFMTENGLAQEAFDLISTTEDGTMSWDLRSEVVQFSEIVTKVMHDISTKTSRIAVAADAEQDKLVQSPDATATPVDTSSSSSDTGGGDDLGGMDDMGDGLDDLGGVKF